MKNLVKATILRYLVLYHIDSFYLTFIHCIWRLFLKHFALQGYIKESESLGYKSGNRSLKYVL